MRRRFTVENEGKPAEAAAAGVLRLPGVLRAVAPEIVILLHGVNDIAFLEERSVTPIAAFVNTMAHDARFAGAQVIICTLPPQRAGSFRAADPAVVSRYNEALRDVARGEGAILVDFAADFGDLQLIGADGLHPTEAGYARMARAAVRHAAHDIRSHDTVTFAMGEPAIGCWCRARLNGWSFAATGHRPGQ